MNKYEALKCKALQAILEPDHHAHVRHIFRYYSHHFATPLHLVEKLPFDFVLQSYYESCFDEMPPEELHEEMVRMTETDAERAAREEKDVRADKAGDEMAELLEKQIAESATKVETPKKRKKNLQPSLGEVRQNTTPAPKEEPLINMNFAPEGNLSEDILNSDPLGATRRR